MSNTSTKGCYRVLLKLKGSSREWDRYKQQFSSKKEAKEFRDKTASEDDIFIYKIIYEKPTPKPHE